MAVPFGFSFGDFVAGVGLVRDIIDALQTSSTSTTRYQGLISELFALERALLEVKKLRFDDERLPQDSRLAVEALISGLQRTAIECQGTIDKLLAKVKKYEGHLSSNGSGSKWKDALRKVQWALLTDKDLEESRAEIRGHSSSINMLLMIVQFEMMRLQQQKANEDQAGLVRWLQKGYIEAMSSLANTVTGIGRQSHKLLEAAGSIVSLNTQIFEKVIQIHEYVSTPRTLEYGEPIYFVDAFGQQTRFHLDYVYSADVLEDWLKRRFHEIGYEKILGGEFALQDIKTRREINISREWQTQLYPGMRLGMDMIYKRHANKINICPGCQATVPGALDEDVECPNCRVQFRRIDEILDTEDTKAVTTRHAQLEVSPRSIWDVQRTSPGHDHYQQKSKSAIETWAYKIRLEKQQMQTFRRFRFQPTRAELELAIMPSSITRFKRIFTDALDSELAWTDPAICDQADDAYRQMQTRMESVTVDTNKPKISNGLINLGFILTKCSRFKEAEEVYRRIINMCREGSDPETEESMIMALTGLSFCRWTQDKNEEAEEILFEALEIALGPNKDVHLDFHILIRSNIALVKFDIGRIQEARDLLANVVNEAMSYYGDYHEDRLIFIRQNHDYIASVCV